MTGQLSQRVKLYKKGVWAMRKFFEKNFKYMILAAAIVCIGNWWSLGLPQEYKDIYEDMEDWDNTRVIQNVWSIGPSSSQIAKVQHMEYMDRRDFMESVRRFDRDQGNKELAILTDYNEDKHELEIR
jgi:hypothetical protein